MTDPAPRPATGELGPRDDRDAAFDLIEAEEGPQRLGPARADEAGDTEDLAPGEGQADRGRHARPLEPVEAEDLRADGVLDPGEELGELLADHELDDLVESRPLHRPRADAPPVPQDGVGVGHPLDLLQEMADVDDAHALVPEAAD